MRLRNHTYIHDGIMYLNYVTDADGNHWRMSQLWENWIKKSSQAKEPIRTVKSFDGGYVTNNIVDLRVAGNHEVLLMTTESNRKMWCGPDTQFLTEDGYFPMKSIGIGAPLVVMDNYKNYYGDTIKLGSDGNSRARALLRNHRIDFEIDEHGGTLLDGMLVYVVDWDVEKPIVHNDGAMDIMTLGLNNYRDELRSMFDLPEYSVDRVVGVAPKVYKKYLIGIYVDGPQNVVLVNGLVVQSTQTEVRNDW